jgi:hypothetical protein
VGNISSVNELVEQLEPAAIDAPVAASGLRPRSHYEIALLVVAVIVFFGCIFGCSLCSARANALGAVQNE